MESFNHDALGLLRGFHDFSSFADKRNDEHLSTEVQIDRTELAAWGDLILFRIAGSHFLWKMVRRIVGILVSYKDQSVVDDTISCLCKAGLK
jgi:tRNA pseudouridine38-40 synthase